MRIWSVHPSSLDQKGLCGAWRELLGAIKSCDPTVGYSKHPQLIRWRNATRSIEEMRSALAHYGMTLYLEGIQRGYRFDFTKIEPYLLGTSPKIPLTIGQLCYEVGFLQKKCLTRSPEWVKLITTKHNPMFILHDGGIEPWEHIKE